jgi:anthranilate phosphoribosyltransferase
MMASVLGNLGVKHALVVHGMDGLDEISISDKTKISHLKDGQVDDYFIKPADLGVAKAKKDDILGGSANENAKAALDILNGEEKGPMRNVVLVNAAAAIFVGGKAKELKEGVKLAAKSIDTGAAKQKLEELIKFTQS